MEKYRLHVIDLCKQQAADVDPKAIQQINFICLLKGNYAAVHDADSGLYIHMYFIYKQSKEIILECS